jgi:hypothetical protein
MTFVKHRNKEGEMNKAKSKFEMKTVNEINRQEK